MIYFCADDYGLCNSVSNHIYQCVQSGALNKVSVLPNFDTCDIAPLLSAKRVELSVHLNLVEGKSVSDPAKIPLLAERDGRLRHSFVGLLRLSLLKPKEFGEQVEKELRAQLARWREIIPPGTSFSVDSHQHVHMIPAIFRILLRVLREDEISVNSIRIPAEPLMPFLMTPSLYCTYRPVNLVKQWILKMCWLFNLPLYRSCTIPSSLFCGVLFSGHMDARRVARVLPHYIRLAEKRGKNVEFLFHPGQALPDDSSLDIHTTSFSDFYFSDNRRKEIESIMQLNNIILSERSV